MIPISSQLLRVPTSLTLSTQVQLPTCLFGLVVGVCGKKMPATVMQLLPRTRVAYPTRKTQPVFGAGWVLNHEPAGWLAHVGST
jgi:hypothetical protein